ncbi:hypothetical protein TrLO_g10415 [Triparma laevis f. longispina]|uniref:Amino acid transporter transmembrane domain-containing protein n=1 Tax=Triparma laevis f. longispina TaxID=1714387 RepID=A0A9W7FMX8_9STRA|nr:hypothetical protein TrLO_g10415 [Triparma laevis f. longispina]
MSLNTLTFDKPIRRHMSLETLSPVFDSSTRHTSLLTSTFNLVSTVIGGGILSIPFAYATTGLLLTSIYVLLASLMAGFSLYILCSCSRRTGGSSYSDVVRIAFGPKAELTVTLILTVFLLFVTTAYMILMRDINTSLLSFLGHPLPPNTVLFYSVLACIPCMLMRDLHSLRYNCYVGFLSVLILLITITLKAVNLNLQNPERLKGNVLLVTDSVYDCTFAFPLIALAFLSQFNMLSVHASLYNPTRERLLKVIVACVGTCTVLFLLFGIAGYMYALGETRDNVLLNFEDDDATIVYGKAGLGVTIMAGISMIVLPCRGAVFETVKLMRSGSKPSAINVNENVPLTHHMKENYMNETQDTFAIDYETRILNDEEDDEPSFNVVTHVLTTIAIALLCFTAACYCPGVSTVWSICGSSLGFVIAYILPSACYLKLRGKKGRNARVVGSWIMLVVSSIGCVVCTIQAVDKVLRGSPTVADEFSDFYDDDIQQ